MLDESPIRAEAGPVLIDLAREAAFSLGGMQVSPSSRELRVGDGAVMLQPRVMQVLVALARRRGEVVSRDDLIQACWGGRTVGEDAINRCIQAIRRLAGAYGGFSVTTVARVGYRLVEAAPAHPGLDAPSRGPSGPSPSGPAAAAPLAGPQAEPQSEPSPEPQNERRHLIVLSCRLVHGNGNGALHDPEERQAIAQRYRRAVTDAVAPFGGYVAKGLGETLLVYFGYPDAREDAAECAVRAGLAIIDALRTPTSPSAEGSGHNLAVRIGVHAGVVVIARSGQDLEMFGEAPDVAALVQAVAEPDTVAVTDAVQALVAGLFVFEERRAQSVDGGEGPIHFRRVVSPVPASRRGPRFAAREVTPYVGRDDEMHLLTSRWKRVRRGEGQLVLLVGEPGIGKTRLVQEFRGRIHGDPQMWIECAAERHVSNTPFHAVVRMLDQGFRWRGDETPQERIEALELALEPSGLQLAEAVPLVAELLNLAVADKYPPPTLAPDQKRRRLLACLAAWVFNLARNRPLIIVMEDLHWADPSTVELLQALVEQGGTSPLMLLCTARPEFRAGWPMRSHHAQLTLDRLTLEETRELVVGVVAKAGLSQDVIEAVIRRTDGVPLFAEELTRLMLESGGRAGEHAIPATLHDSLAARLDQLGRAKEVAQLGAVLGREFSYALIAAVSPMSADQLQAGLSRLVEAELLYVRGTPPEASYQFKHALILDVAYEALLKGRRRELHALVARTMSERFPALAARQPEVLARHWSEAGEAEQAIGAWTRAATAATGRHAYEEAIESYRQALAVLATLPETPERDTRELELVIPLSGLVGVVLGYPSPEYVELGDRGAALAERSGGLPQLVMQFVVRFVSAFTSGEQVKALELADQLLHLARREGGDNSLRMAHMAQVAGRHGVGDFVGAEAHFGPWSEIVARSGHGHFLAETTVVLAAAFETAYQLGRPDLARRRVASATKAAEASGSPFEIGLALMMEAWLNALLRRPADAAAAAARALAIAEEHGFTQANQNRNCLAWALAHLGDTAQAVALAEQSLPGWVGGGMPRLAEARRVLAQVQALNGQKAEALAGLDSLCAAPIENPAILCAHLICRAELQLDLGRAEPAEADLRAAIALAQPRQARAMELRAATLLARLLRARDDDGGARALLAPVYAGFAEGFDTLDLQEARALLDELV